MREKPELKYPNDCALEAYLQHNKIAPEPLYLFINEHPTASPRCRSGPLKIPAADHMQSSLYLQTGCTADSRTLECA